MTNNATTPKALLRGQELIGFRRPNSGGDHLVQRASSAKVFGVEPTSISDPAKVSPVGAPRQARKSN